MMQQHIDRSRQTRGGMTASFALHAGLFLLLALAAGGQAARSALDNDLVEIAYIEARYGEDVAAKVKLKDPFRNRPEPAGRGVNSQSAQQAPEPAAPGPRRPEPRPVTRPELPVARELPKQVVTEIAAPTIETKVQPTMLAAAPQLSAREAQPRNRVVIDPGRLNDTPRLVKDDVTVPARATPRDQGTFKPQKGALQSRSGAVALGSGIRPDTGPSSRDRAGNSSQVLDGPASLATGGSLAGNSRAAYQAPKSGLAPAGVGGGAAGGKGVLDVAGPSGGNGGKKSGRKTILNYGSGGGGRSGGGGLSGRARLAEPDPTRKIVAEAAPESAPQQAVAEVKLEGNGVGMTISGQISGRKILKSVVPEYTTKARRNGWEGVVAVHFTVLADGRVKDNTYLEQSSVHRDLNQMALKAIKKFRFAPLPSDQAAIEQWGVITIVFRLN